MSSMIYQANSALHHHHPPSSCLLTRKARTHWTGFRTYGVRSWGMAWM